MIASLIWKRLLSWMTSKTKVSSQLICNNCVLLINYTRGNENYSIRIPYSRRLSGKMSQYEVLAIYADHTENITQQSGIPYLITPQMLGADYFLVRYLTNGREIKIEANDIIPLQLFEH